MLACLLNGHFKFCLSWNQETIISVSFRVFALRSERSNSTRRHKAICRQANSLKHIGLDELTAKLLQNQNALAKRWFRTCAVFDYEPRMFMKNYSPALTLE